MIYHVVTEPNWQNALQQGFYEADSLAKEGFIHTSKATQVAGVLERYYQGQSNLLLLHIEEEKLTAPLKYELAPSDNEEFPHIYGKLNLNAVTKVENL